MSGRPESRKAYITPDDDPKYPEPKGVKKRGTGGQGRVGQETGQGKARTKAGSKKADMSKPIPMNDPRRARNWEGEKEHRKEVAALNSAWKTASSNSGKKKQKEKRK